MRKSLRFCSKVLAALVLVLVACSPPAAPTQELSVTLGIEDDGTPQRQTTETTAERIQIRWFIGLSTGKDAGAVAVAKAFVEEYNASQDEIELVLEVSSQDVHGAVDELRARVESGDAPDIIAPVGEYSLLADYDLSDADSRFIDTWRTSNYLVGPPIGFDPAVIYYNRDLFDKAGLAYPPHKYGEPYADGDAWTIEKMEEIATLLTIDSEGNNANNPEFNPNETVQWGFHWQWSSAQGIASLFGPGQVVDAGGNATIPDNWREAFHWYYEGMHEKHFIPSGAHRNTLAHNPFRSGKVAMVQSHLWYLSRLDNVAFAWNVAAVPSYNGKTTVRWNIDAVGVLNTTDHPKGALEVAYTLATTPELLAAWGDIPALRGIEAQVFDAFDAQYPGVNWRVAVDGIEFACIPHHDNLTMPGFAEAFDRFLKLPGLMTIQGNLDLDGELDRLEADLQAIFTAAAK